MRRDQDEEIALRLRPIGHAKESADDREIDEYGDTRLADAHRGLGQTTHDRRLAVSDEHFVVDLLRRKDGADVVRLELHVGVLDVDLHLHLTIRRDLRRHGEDDARLLHRRRWRAARCSSLPVDDPASMTRIGTCVPAVRFAVRLFNTLMLGSA